jgi:uncharacterized protein (DUF58 family)
MTSTGTLANARRSALQAARRWRLPFSHRAWRGAAGSWLGVGAGTSLDFQDHRAYAPGDDPRHIHWAAYARTSQLTMKLYRAEVAPFVDLIVDVSASMTLTEDKARRTDELVAFCVESADRAAAPCRLHAVQGRSLHPIQSDEVRSGRWRERLPAWAGAAATGTAATAPGPLPWRSGALKVLISDLLFPGDPAVLLGGMAGSAGVAVVFAPAAAGEAELALRGNVELHDCESALRRRQRVDDRLDERYRAAYARHFALWGEASRRRGVLLARVPAAGELTAVLAGPALAAGAVEPHT